MSQVSETLQAAIEHHRAGDLARAEDLYRQVLALEPDNCDAHHLLGMAAYVQGQAPRAVEHFERAMHASSRSVAVRHHLGIALSAVGRHKEAIDQLCVAISIDPESAPLYNDLATALRAIGQDAEAETNLREAIRRDPDLGEAHNNLGNLLRDTGRVPAAIESLRTALCLRPDAVEVHFNLGTCYAAQQKWPEAEAAYRRALALAPGVAAAHRSLGVALFSQQRHVEAIAEYREALRLEPANAEALVGLGGALQAAEQFDEAEACYRRALTIKPDDSIARYNLGGTLFAKEEHAAAIECFRAVIGRAPNETELQFRLGQSLQFEGRCAEAIAAYDRAIAAQADNAEYHYYRAVSRMAGGDLAGGWNEYEWRLRTKYAAPPHSQPRWNGEPLGGQRIVAHSEWGFGDTLQFVRYVPMIEARGGDVVLEVQRGLIPLLRTSGFRQVVPIDGTATPECAWHVPLLSLGGIFQTTLDTIPSHVPYLSAEPELVEAWRRRLNAWGGFRIGIHWHGSKAWSADNRSIPLAAFEPLSRLAGVTLISLQKNDPTDQLKGREGRWPVIDFGDELDAGGAFMDTAAIMKNLDLVITCDTSIAHVAGALGAPVWVALPRANEWRWMWNRDDSPWYPTMKLFRQPRPRDWPGVLAQVAEELTALVGASAKS